MTEDQLSTLCVDRFPLSASRGLVMAGLSTVLARLKQVGLNAEVWIDGSFLTEKIDPEDVDIAIRLSGTDWEGATEQISEVVDWAVSDDVCRSHRVDGYVWADWPADHPQHELGKQMRSYWTKWYGASRSEQPKGIVVISLGAGIP